MTELLSLASNIHIVTYRTYMTIYLLYISNVEEQRDPLVPLTDKLHKQLRYSPSSIPCSTLFLGGVCSGQRQTV